MFTGCGTALVTPFRPDGSLDEKTLRGLVRRQIEHGINFLVPCGTTGESPTLTHEEHVRVVDITLDEAKGKVPVLAGAGGYNTAEVIALGRELAAIQVPFNANPIVQGLHRELQIGGGFELDDSEAAGMVHREQIENAALATGEGRHLAVDGIAAE